MLWLRKKGPAVPKVLGEMKAGKRLYVFEGVDNFSALDSLTVGKALERPTYIA